MSAFQTKSSSDRMRHKRNLLLYQEEIRSHTVYRKDSPNYQFRFQMTDGKTQLYTTCIQEECVVLPYLSGRVEYTILTTTAITLQDILDHVPIINTSSSFTYTTEILDHSPSYVVHVIYKYTLSDSMDGFSFYNHDIPELSVCTWFNETCSNVNLTSFGNIPLSRGGNQFYTMNHLSISSETQPTLLPYTTGYQMFYQCADFSPIQLNWNFAHLTSMERMFYGCTLLNLPLIDWSVPKVTSMRQTFMYCTTLNPSVFQLTDTSLVVDMTQMFKYCAAFTTNIVDWNVSSVMNFSEMFYGCTNCTLNLSTWVVSVNALRTGFSLWSSVVPPSLWG